MLDVCIEVRGQFVIDGGYFFPPYRSFGSNSGHQVGSSHLHLLSKPLVLFSETRSLNEPSQLDWLAMESPGFPVSSAQHWGDSTATTSSALCDCRDPNLCFHACTANMIPMEPSLQRLHYLFIKELKSFFIYCPS